MRVERLLAALLLTLAVFFAAVGIWELALGLLGLAVIYALLRSTRVVGRCATVGALLLVTVLISRSWGEYEGSDVIVALGPFAALLGAAAGAGVGIVSRAVRGWPGIAS